ncbi:hypothetical protein V7x_08500 [Crateriforma conspicua]|uniref:Uncharacterized protein n=1 Tax=Crateriforma conspicua TaxID=2527996 RepID=A0A5C6FSQ8_9PLAN|nr:hypothetical protein V7x_08500 [Crateriforma conspicua]
MCLAARKTIRIKETDSWPRNSSQQLPAAFQDVVSCFTAGQTGVFRVVST